MNHDWRPRIFHCDDVYEGERTCCQTWECARCEKTIKLPSEIQPCVPGECHDTRLEREEKRLRLVEIQKRLPTGWGNGNKGRRTSAKGR